jgi:hypothetical protein
MSTLDFYRNQHHLDPSFFDEGPKVVVKPIQAVNTSSIDTSLIDGYRQGVELTQQKYFDAGAVKISAGEPGHVLHRNRYGMDRNFRQENAFAEIDYFNPVRYVAGQAQDGLAATLQNTFTFPIVTGDADQLENYLFDGVIEPLTIRAVTSFFSIEAPFESHASRGALMAGNCDHVSSSDRILTVDRWDPVNHQFWYLDMVDMMSGSSIPYAGFFTLKQSSLDPFVDARYPRNVALTSSRGSDMDGALSLMTGSTDNYVSFAQRSSACGWDYNNNASVGTDSIAFGGMTY